MLLTSPVCCDKINRYTNLVKQTKLHLTKIILAQSKKKSKSEADKTYNATERIIPAEAPQNHQKE